MLKRKSIKSEPCLIPEMLIIIIFSIILAFAAGIMSESKGYSFWLGFIFGFFWVGIIIVIFMPNKSRIQFDPLRTPEPQEYQSSHTNINTISKWKNLTKKCPVCRKEISLYDTHCKYCRSNAYFGIH